MARIGKDCLNCGKELDFEDSSKSGGCYKPLCKKCIKRILICPSCKGKIKETIQSNFVYSVICKCGYCGRPTDNTQTDNIPSVILMEISNTTEIQRNIEENLKKNQASVLVGKYQARETVNAVLNILKKYPNINVIKLKARGKYISKAVDVLEILKRELEINSAIKTTTKEVVSKNRELIKLSVIKITLTNFQKK